MPPTTFHPFTPLHPVSVFMDSEIQEIQDRIYYMTSRLRAILIHRLDPTNNQTPVSNWNVLFQYEAQLASATIGWATLAGVTVDVPYLLRSICINAAGLTLDQRVSFTPEFHALLAAPLDASRSVFLRHSEQYTCSWWTPGWDYLDLLSEVQMSVAMYIHYSRVTGKGTMEPQKPRTGPFLEMAAAASTSGKAPPNRRGLRLPDLPVPPMECPNCRSFEEAARKANEALKETLLHVSGMAQFAEWNLIATQRESEAFETLLAESHRVQRNLEDADVVALASGRASPAVDAIGSDYNITLPAGTQGDANPSSRGIPKDGINEALSGDIAHLSGRLSAAPDAVMDSTMDIPPAELIQDNLDKTGVFSRVARISEWRNSSSRVSPHGKYSQQPPDSITPAPHKINTSHLGSLFTMSANLRLRADSNPKDRPAAEGPPGPASAAGIVARNSVAADAMAVPVAQIEQPVSNQEYLALIPSEFLHHGPGTVVSSGGYESSSGSEEEDSDGDEDELVDEDMDEIDVEGHDRQGFDGQIGD